MIEPNDRPVKTVAPRSRRRTGAAWKSGLVLTGLGAVVLGAGYLAGVNAPAVNSGVANAAGANAAVSTPQPVAQAPAGRLSDDDAAERGPQGALGSEDRLFLGYDEEGNAVYLKSDGSLEFRADEALSQGSQFAAPSGSQSRGLAQQQPNFRRPLTRSRGS